MDFNLAVLYVQCCHILFSQYRSIPYSQNIAIITALEDEKRERTLELSQNGTSRLHSSGNTSFLANFTSIWNLWHIFINNYFT
jgi:hypothetical protein